MAKTRTLVGAESSTTAVAERPSNGQLVLPSGFPMLPAVPLPDTGPSTASGSYIQCASTKSPNWAQQSAAGLRDGDFFLNDGGQMLKQMPLKFHLLRADKFWTKMNSLGEVTRCSREEPDDKGTGPDKWQEHYVALMAIIAGDRIIPSRSEFRGTKSNAVTNAIHALEAASQPGWATQSDAHRVSAQFPEPWGRFVVTATTQVKTARASGSKYHAAASSIAPSTIEQLERLVGACRDPLFQEALKLAVDGFTERVKVLEAKPK